MVDEGNRLPDTPPPLPRRPRVSDAESPGRRPALKADERYCQSCGSIMKMNDLACPGCGRKVKQRQSMPGCAIAAIVAVGGLFILGILAAIAIPNFLTYRARGMEASVASEMRNVVAAQQQHFSRHGRYAATLDELGYTPKNPRISVEIVGADQNCFEAKGTMPLLEKEIWVDCGGILEARAK